MTEHTKSKNKNVTKLQKYSFYLQVTNKRQLLIYEFLSLGVLFLGSEYLWCLCGCISIVSIF